MRCQMLIWSACLLGNAHGTPVTSPRDFDRQLPLEDLEPSHTQQAAPQLHGRFLHITDLHPDPFYKAHSSTDEDAACHRGKGSAGAYGAETSDCDSPFSLIDATFDWIEENIRDTVDFVVWTGDSARHDSDEAIPRKQDEVVSTNRRIAEKFVKVFGDKGELSIPIVPTFGNNDILPHNILLSGPNKWLKTYTDIWNKFIPEEQRHGFQRGGWFYTEVIPQKLAIFSLNTLYFFTHNAAVDGCSLKSEPGYEHMEWLRIQLEFMRQRGMKAILTGHVPPARTDSKQLWDETCWQKYTLWLQQYRDVVIGGLYGHMNIDHFMMQDSKQVDLAVVQGIDLSYKSIRTAMDDEFTIMSASDYLEELRDKWSGLPKPAVLESGEMLENSADAEQLKKKKGRKSKDKYKQIGGPFGERFQVTSVGPSIVPNYFPTLRVINYNITGLDATSTWANMKSVPEVAPLEETTPSPLERGEDIWGNPVLVDEEASTEAVGKKKKKKKKGGKKHKNPDLNIPDPPAKTSPPGPAYSPQTLTLLGYTQYFANLTEINNMDYVEADALDDLETEKWRDGKHKGKKPKHPEPKPKTFQFEVEYDTFTDPIYKMRDMTVRSYIELARRIGKYKPIKGKAFSSETAADEVVSDEGEDEGQLENVHTEGRKSRKGDQRKKKKEDKKKKAKKRRKQLKKNRVWLNFIQRAFVGTLDEKDLSIYETRSTREDLEESIVKVNDDLHDGEL